MLLLLLLLAAPAAAAYNCTTVNGVEGACELKLSQLTLAGSRLSGCGAYGGMYFWSGIAATSCAYATQDKTFTEQLEMGIRYFDFDLSYIHKSQESLPYWEEGPVMVSIGSSVAYSRSLRKALTEIRDFLNSNRNEVVSMRIKKYHPVTREMRDNLLKSISPLFNSVFGPEGSEGVQLTWETSITNVGRMIADNQRMVLYLNKDLWGTLQSDSRAHALNDLESQDNLYGYKSCQNQHQIAEYLLNFKKINFRNLPVVVNWWLASGHACNTALAELCTEDVEHLQTVYDEVLEGTHLDRPVNVVLADYVQPSLVREVNKMNEKAVKYYADHPW